MGTLSENRNEAQLLELATRAYLPHLAEAEAQVIRDSVRPGPVAIPKVDHSRRVVRGEFLRWLLNDPAAIKLFDKDGLQVAAATIEGDVDLDNAHIPCGITFNQCRFVEDLHLVSAEISGAQFAQCTAEKDVSFENCIVKGDLSFTQGFHSQGSIRLYGAHISGDLDLTGATLSNTKGQLSLDNAVVDGTVYMENITCATQVFMISAKIGLGLIANRAYFQSPILTSGLNVNGDLSAVNARSKGSLDLERATIAGSLYLSGGNFEGDRTTSNSVGNSLSARSATITGDVFLTDGFQASGITDLSQVTIKGTLFAYSSKFAGLICRDAQIKEMLWAATLEPPNGKLDLGHASVEVYRDSKDSWPTPGNLNAVGFVYRDISLEVPPHLSSPQAEGNDPTDRITWLELQDTENRAATQPWLQLAQYVRSKGSDDGYKKVLFAMKKQQTRGVLSEIYLSAVENPLIPFSLTFTFWGASSLIFWRARRMKAMIPSESDARKYFEQFGNQPPEYCPFNALAYTIENGLPVVKLGQDDKWAPNPQAKQQIDGWKGRLPGSTYTWLALLRWGLIITGWVLATIIAGMIGSLIK